MRNRRNPFHLLWGAGMAAFFGATAFIGVCTNPRFETIHVLDVIRLMTAGAAIAVTLTLLIRYFNLDPRSEDNRAAENSSDKSH